jgi:hypothetical protein
MFLDGIYIFQHIFLNFTYLFKKIVGRRGVSTPETLPWICFPFRVFIIVVIIDCIGNVIKNSNIHISYTLV